MKILIKKVLKTDLNFTFLLRNNKLIRKNFFTSNIISIKEHKDWFLKKIKNKKDLFLIIMKDKHKIGTIRYDKKEFYYEISISILPKYQSQNLGSEALKASENIVKKGMILSNIMLIGWIFCELRLRALQTKQKKFLKISLLMTKVLTISQKNYFLKISTLATILSFFNLTSLNLYIILLFSINAFG